jgi:farnesyl-diphosphate farnesyltransferase
MVLLEEAHEVVRAYSTTWYQPVVNMPTRLNETVSCAYLMMRGVDEIEDHPTLHSTEKATLLRNVSRTLRTRPASANLAAVFREHDTVLPEVTLQLGEWVALPEPEIGPRVYDTFATMAERMANWAETGFAIRTGEDLDRYTYDVAGTLVLMLSDLWAWYDGTTSDRHYGIGYGRALQTVNILIDRDDDTSRSVDFWPDGWQQADMVDYAHAELKLATAYVHALPQGPARTFCSEPLARARRALAAAGRRAENGAQDA